MNNFSQNSQQGYPYVPYGYMYPNGYEQTRWGFKGGNQTPTPTQMNQTTPPPAMSGSQITPQGQVVSPAAGAFEESYIENILRLNLGKIATIYMTFENKQQQVFKGRLEAAGRDHIIISDPQTGKRYLLLMVYLDYITFDEELNYSYPFDSVPVPTGGTTR